MLSRPAVIRDLGAESNDPLKSCAIVDCVSQVLGLIYKMTATDFEKENAGLESILRGYGLS